MRWRSPLPFVAGSMLLLGLMEGTVAQVASRWVIPNGPQKVDLSSQNPERHLAFLDDGLAIQVPLNFVLIRHSQVSIVAELPEPGRFDVKLTNARALAEVKNVRVEGRQGRAEVVAKVAPMSPEEVVQKAKAALDKLLEPGLQVARNEVNQKGKESLRKYLEDQRADVPKKPEELHQTYVRTRAAEQMTKELRAQLEELARKKPRWFTQKEKDQWPKSNGHELADSYGELLEYEIAVEHLQKSGLDFDGNTPDFKRLILPRFQGVFLAMSGKAAENPADAKKVAELLDARDTARLRHATTINLECRFYPEVDLKDPNAQWFNGQRVTCQASGVVSIRVEGKLDPKKNDRVDWWILQRYDPATTIMDVPKDPRFRVDPPFVSDNLARLRVIATGDEPVEYSFEFRRSEKSGNIKVVIHESPSASDAKFPF